jgi:hypothetical protein
VVNGRLAGSKPGALATGGVSPTSGGTGDGASSPRSAGRDAIPAIAIATIAKTLPTLAHLICLPVTPR